ncbi:hypothetical protein PVAND_003685 [Polypedilum vanderplanki]|uniref:Protein Skeletor n=1 Tax=Polypedilum vanderplanki TaxID=319348 RepID=A0A9J6BUT1_POLVA|nr:hypothetical protein PVAND_003685 [Polypedilum vanderplanki]
MNSFRVLKNIKNIVVLLLVLILKSKDVECQDDDDGPYRGKFIGKFNSYHHQVSGDVYAVDSFTFLIVDFNYDGNGIDTFFWSGASNRPGPQGFIVADEHGKTNVLERYFNKEFTIKLPDNKRITEVKWLAIYDLQSQNTFGDVYIPENFDPPSSQRAGSFSKISHNVSSGSIEILDSKTIRIPNFSYDGLGKSVYFWAGVGAQPASKGFKIPDDLGYLDPIRAYNEETITLELPGERTIFEIDWLSIFDLDTNENFGSILIANGLNVPPSLTRIIPHQLALPNCKQLHKNFQVQWEVFGPAVTMLLNGKVDIDDYMSFGISGSDTKSQMVGADAAVTYIDGHLGYAVDYHIDSLASCVQVLDVNKGVCKDTDVGGQDNFQLHTAMREDGINKITFRRSLISSDALDKEFVLDRPMFVVWSMGKLDSNKEPAFHTVYPKKDLQIHFNSTEPFNDCFSFTDSPPKQEVEIWEPVHIFDKNLRLFNATLGPSAGKKGYLGITKHVANSLSWYINGALAPELYMRRGLTYAFKVRGGNNPHSTEYYHPLIITNEPIGGFDKLSDSKQKEIRVLAGVEFTRRGRPKPTVAGPLCLLKYPENYDRRLDDNFMTFRKFHLSLIRECEGNEAATLEITPNSSWPDTVYYNSFTQRNMGWKIHIVDNFARPGQFSDAITLFSCISKFLIIVCTSTAILLNL